MSTPQLAPVTGSVSAPAMPARATEVRRAQGVWSISVAIVVGLCVLVGIALRAWYLAHSPINSDEAVAGLMAEAMLHGHFYAFSWGATYGGTAEVAVVAVMFALFGKSSVVLQLSATVLWAAVSVLTWRVARRLVANHLLALLAAGLVWVASEVAVQESTVEVGAHLGAVVTGLVSLLFALRILDGKRRLWNFAVLGLAIGMAWWSSPESAYLLIPAVLVVAGAVARSRGEPRKRWAARAVIGGGALVLGALPWLWANLGSGFASLSPANAPGIGMTYAQRFTQFFRLSAPIELGLKARETGLRVFGNPGSPAWERVGYEALIIVAGLVLLVAFVLCLRRGGRALALAVSLLLYPFLYALSPASWYWRDGRYAVCLGVLVALLLAVAADAPSHPAGEPWVTVRQALVGNRPAWARRRALDQAPLLAFGVVVLVSGVLTLTSFRSLNGTGPGQYTLGWANPDDSEIAAVHHLEADHLTRGFADYWVAYRMDFLGGSQMAITPLANNRSDAIMARAESGSGQAWLFQAPVNGPDGLSLSQVASWMQKHHILYRLVNDGPVTALVPDSDVTPQQLK